MRALRRWRAAALIAGAMLALPAAAHGSVQVGSSGWQWGNPLPQGNTLRAMSFAGPAAGYAVGDFGTLLRTADGGATWVGLRAATYTNLTRVQAVDADTVVAGGGCVARRSDDGGQTFARIAFTPVESSCRVPLEAMWFVTERLGYLVLDDGSVFETTDGGTEFAQKTAVPGTHATNGPFVPTDVRFLSESVGLATTTAGQIFRTTDGGTSWNPVASPGRAVQAITFTDANTGYAVGDNGLFLSTTDGGATWAAKDVAGPNPLNFKSISCASATRCVAATWEGKVLAITNDGGASWAFPSPSTDPMYAAAFASATQLAAAGELGSTVISADAGATFTPVGGRLLGSTFTAIRAGGQAGTAFALGPNGTLGKTVDGGVTWTRGNVATSEDVRDASFPTKDVGYALDSLGGLFRTSTGGSTWKALDPGTTGRAQAVFAPSADTVLVIGPRGIRRSTDGGNTFASVTSKAVAGVRLNEVDRAGSAIVAFGFQDIAMSTDNGRTWRVVRKPGNYVKRGGRAVNRLGLQHVDFVSASRGFAIDTTLGVVWRTSNGGRSWTALRGVGTNQIYGMSFSSASSGYLVIDRFGDVRQRSGWLLRTDDGGVTWHPQFVVSTPINANGLDATPGTDYLLGGSSALLFSTSEGDSGSPSTLSVSTSKTKLRKPATVRVSGRLSPASGGESVTVSFRPPGSNGWRAQTVKTAANGSFTTSWRVAKGINTFVAQWPGDFRSRGDGSKALLVTVGK